MSAVRRIPAVNIPPEPMAEESVAAYAARLYHETLLSEKGAEARAYLSRRGITEHTVRRYRIGYAPHEWNYLVRRPDNHSRAALEAADLVRSRREGRGAYDTFRGRLMLPYTERGQAVGFSGRILPAFEEGVHRYHNSRGMPKSRLLFGWDEAQMAIRREGAVYLVEGQIDTLAMASAGRHNVVGIGRALFSRAQAERLASLNCKVVLVPDSDNAGHQAILRNAEKLADCGAELHVATLSLGKDAGEVLASKGPEALYQETATDRHVLAAAPKVIEMVSHRPERPAVDPAEWSAKYARRFPEKDEDRLLSNAPNRAAVEEQLEQLKRTAQKRNTRRPINSSDSRRVTDEMLHAVRSDVSLVETARRYTDLESSGDSWKGCCPAHADSDPSFYVREGKGFHCFGCGFEGGDAISLFMQMEKVDFRSAVRQLAVELDPSLVSDTPARQGDGLTRPKRPEATMTLPSQHREYVYHHLYMALRETFKDPAEAFNRLDVMHKAGTLHHTREHPELLGEPRSPGPLSKMRQRKRARDIVSRYMAYVEKTHTAPVKPKTAKVHPTRAITNTGKAATRAASTLYRGARVFFER